MLDTALLRRDFSTVAQNLRRRGMSPDEAEFQRLETRRKETQENAETLRAQRNKMARDSTGGGDDFRTKLQQSERDMNNALTDMDDYLLRLPNMLHESVPDGEDESANAEVRRWGEPPTFDFTPLDHAALGKKWEMMDFDSAATMASSRFVVLSGELARLHRALAQFMLDVHVREHGYVEYYMPHLANTRAMTGAGQLPKFANEVYVAEKDELYLIPTAEVSLVNLARDRIWSADELPARMTAHTACFRREAGSYGRDTRGMLRQHQFDKVELVQICAPADSYAVLEELTSHAEHILRLLELPYRVVSLCGGDIGFAAAKTYDLEVWMPGQKRYREISSCSNCESFQARRIKARCRGAGQKPEYAHTLNGSGVAVGRALIAVMENFQQSDGSVQVPPPLVPYMGGCEQIPAR